MEWRRGGCETDTAPSGHLCLDQWEAEESASKLMQRCSLEVKENPRLTRTQIFQFVFSSCALDEAGGRILINVWNKIEWLCKGNRKEMVNLSWNKVSNTKVRPLWMNTKYHQQKKKTFFQVITQCGPCQNCLLTHNSHIGLLIMIVLKLQQFGISILIVHHFMEDNNLHFCV